MSDSGDYTDIGSDPFAAFSYTDPSELDTGSVGFVTVTPQVTLPDDPSSSSSSSPSSGSNFDISNLIATIGKTFASTYNAVNNPGASSSSPPATSSYGATQAAGGSAPASGASSLFKPPMLYYLMGGAGVLLLLMTKKGDS